MNCTKYCLIKNDEAQGKFEKKKENNQFLEKQQFLEFVKNIV